MLRRRCVCVCVCWEDKELPPDTQRWRLAPCEHTPLWLLFVWPLACSPQDLQQSDKREVATMLLYSDFLEMDSSWLLELPLFTQTFLLSKFFLGFLFCVCGKWFVSAVWHHGAAGTCCNWTQRFLSRLLLTRSQQQQLAVRWDVCWRVDKHR